MKVLYLYSGMRSQAFTGVPGVDYPDTQLYGLDHLKDFGMHAEFKEFEGGLLARTFPAAAFRFRHFVSFWFIIRGRYDIVFGPSLMYLLPLAKIFRPRAKLVLLNFSLTRIMRSHRRGSVKRKFLDWLLCELDAVVSLSKAQEEELLDLAPQLGAKSHVALLGVDARYHTPVFTGRTSTILSVGRDNGRDYKTVLAVARLMPERTFEIVCSRRNLAGVGEIPANVRVFYDMPKRELREKYRTAGFLLLLTHADDHPEGSDCSGQTVLLDAMASGLPVIASKKKYIREYAHDRHEIALVDFYNAPEVAEVISRLAPRHASDMAHAARARVERELSTRAMASSLAFIFRNL